MIWTEWSVLVRSLWLAPKVQGQGRKTHYSDRDWFGQFDRRKSLRQRQQPFVKNMKSQKMKRFYWACRGSPMKRIFRLSRPFLVSSRSIKSWVDRGWRWSLFGWFEKNKRRNWGFQMRLSLQGWSHQMRQALYYKAADFFISASTGETQGLTYLEYCKWYSITLMAILISIMWLMTYVWKALLWRETRHKWFWKRLTRCLQSRWDQVGRKIDDISAATFGRRVLILPG